MAAAVFAYQDRASEKATEKCLENEYFKEYYQIATRNGTLKTTKQRYLNHYNSLIIFHFLLFP